MGITEKFKEELKYHLVDTTALLSSTNPIYSAMEVGIAGMSDKLSIDSRLTVAGISYAGLALAFTRGRDLSRKVFKITGETREKIQTAHDIVYTTGFNLALTPLIYLSMGSNVKQALIGGASAAVLSPVIGPIAGYSIDVARDLTGLKECERPSYENVGLKNRKSLIKKGLATLLTAGSITAMAGIYSLTPEKHDINNNHQTVIEQIEESNPENISIRN